MTAPRAVAARGEAHIADALAPVLARCVARRAAARRPLLQRTVQTAAQALWDEGHRTLEDWLLQAWLADQSGAGTTNAVHHGVNAGDLAAINNGLAAIANFHAGVRQMRSDTGRRGAFTRGQLLTWLGAGGHAPAFPAVTQQRLGEVNVLIAQIEQEEERDRRIAAAQRKLATAQAEAPGVGIDHHGISVNLDTDQLKHQPSEYPIGTRQTSGGTKYSAALRPDAAWHQATTLPIIGEWARGLVMQDGDDEPSRQTVNRSGHKFEGFCVQVDGRKHVYVHCYPA